MKKRRSPFLWLLLFPAAVLVFLLACALGVVLDLVSLPGSTPETAGHPAPVFMILCIFVGAILALGMMAASVVLTVVGVIRRRREQRKPEPEQRAPWEDRP